MNITRREFIERTGIALAALVMARCGSSPQPSPTPSTRGRLRGYWLQFGWLAQQTDDASTGDFGEGAMRQLAQDHRAALDELVASGELTPAVADQVQSAYSAAAYHVWRSNAPITCYEPMIIDYKPTSSGQLIAQAQVLVEMAESGDLNPDTVAQARANIERDMAFLSLSYEEVQALYTGLIEAAGDSYNFPPFDQLVLDVPSEAIEAARFLADLLLGDESQ